MSSLGVRPGKSGSCRLPRCIEHKPEQKTEVLSTEAVTHQGLSRYWLWMATAVSEITATIYSHGLCVQCSTQEGLCFPSSPPEPRLFSFSKVTFQYFMLSESSSLHAVNYLRLLGTGQIQRHRGHHPGFRGFIILYDPRTGYNQLGIKRSLKEESFKLNLEGRGQRVWQQVHSGERKQHKQRPRLQKAETAT